ncbi:hypothetical protein [Desulfosporosinus meridiei]|nr:hypothetical protein [Desulfosporosinus meridiei]
MANEALKKKPIKPHPKIKFEDTKGFKALDRLMRSNKGISGPM